MKRLLMLLLPILALALAACSGSQAPTGGNTITVKAGALKYAPATIEVTAGQTVRLVFENDDSVDHDFSIMEFPMAMMATAAPMAGHDMSGMTDQPQLHMAVAMGQTGTMEFTPTKPGTYEFFCTVPGHREAGMIGTLIVKSP